jgi:membrane fusion protein (multidrug efflux system)
MEVEKVRPLVEKGIISKYELQSKQYTLQSAQASLASANAELANAKVNVGYTYLTSPSDGIIGTIPYKKGSLVSSSSGSPLTTVYNTKNVYAYFSLNEKQLLDFSRQVEGATVQDKLATMQDVILVLADGTQYAQKGRITTATGLINTQTGSANFRATFPNTQGLIRSGSSATIKVPVTIKNSLLVPQAATFDNQGKKFVYRIVGKDSISSVGIEVTENRIGNLYIVANGLTKEDQVVIEGVGSIRPGTKITPIPANKDSVYADIMSIKKDQ